MIKFILGTWVGGAVAVLFLACFRVGADFDKNLK